ncbi:MAG: hypothetical protein IKA50_00660 [Clostridia bacterium]|nr:hypothetical protein [Clostridia bacterium]
MKKRLLSLFLLLTLLLTLVGCGDDTAANKTGGSETTVAITTPITSATKPAASSTALQVESTGGDETKATTPATKPTAGSSVVAPSTTITAPPTTTATKAPTTTAPTVSAADKQLVDRAFGLAQGEKMEGVTLTGVVTSSQGYSEGYNNATFDLQVQGTSGAKTIYCYRVKPADASRPEVAVGDRLSLSGTIQNYKGTIEFYPAEYTHLGGGGTTATTTRPTNSGSATIDENGIYDSKEDVALYIHIYGKLPKNYVTKNQYNKNDRYQCVGGDRFYNKEGRLPSGEIYYECDIDTYGITSRGAKRLVWTKSGIVYYTADHYETFTKMYGER